MVERERLRRVPEEWRSFWEDNKREVEEKFEIALEEAERCDIKEAIRTYTAAVRMLTRLPNLFIPEIEEVRGAADYLDRRLWNEIYPKLVAKLERCKLGSESRKSHGSLFGQDTGILRCRYCGAPYAYKENLELHEKTCQRGGG